ncbi:MAG: HD family phosphohydrolase [Bacillota bacterium]
MKLMKRLRVKLRKFRREHLSFSQNTHKIIWAVIFFILLSLTLTLDLIPNRIDLKAGQVSKNDITAPRTLTFVDDNKTEELKKMAAERAPKVYEEDSNVNSNINRNLNMIFTAVQTEKNNFIENKILKEKSSSEEADAENSEDNLSKEENSSFDFENLSDEEKNNLTANVKSKINFDIEEQTINTLLNTEDEELLQLKKYSQNLINEELAQRVLPSDIPDTSESLRQAAMEIDISREQRLAVSNIITTVIEPNMFLNVEETEKRRQEAIGQVEPVKRTIRQGEIIVRKGDVVQPEDIVVLEKLGLQKSRINYLNIFGTVLIVFILILLLGFYFRKYQDSIWNSNTKLLLIELLIFIVIMLAKIFTIFQNPFMDYLVPTAMASILLTVLIDSKTALISTIFLSFLIAPVFNMNFNIVLTSFLAGLVGIFSVSRVKERGDLIRAGFNVSLLLVFAITGLSFLERTQDWMYLLWAVTGGILNGILVGVLANGFLPYLEDLFDMTSSVKLLELSNPSQPVLKRLLVEAPGSYHHSIIVGNLAETAAENIGADALLARTGAYYHDIGKLKRPYFFSDNQFGGENPHDKTSPNLSSLIIKSHVKDGVELAEEYGLPSKIIDIIKQHHGTNLISYFYQQALQDDKHNNVEKSDFRYDGPKPQSREAAIIMLADIVEAAVRSKNFNKNNHNRIEGFVRGLIKDKLIENQLDECDLTLKDLDIIASSFVKVLTGIYHQRVEYPENIIKEMKGKDNND